MELRDIAHRTIHQAIEAVKPDVLIRRKLHLSGNRLRIERMTISLDTFQHIYVVGMGKASAWMAREFEQLLEGRIDDGVVVVKYGHSVPCQRIRIREAGHPVLDENGLQATAEILQIAQQAGEDDLVFCLISGGGSALLEQLPPGISLTELQETFQLLLASGANIEEVNTIRKHLSLVKGGQLARAIAPARCISLILSDVIGDPLEAIASGPTAPDPTTFQDAWKIVEKYHLSQKLPASVRNYLQAGLAGNQPETLKPNDPIFRNVQNIILGNNREALRVAEQTLREAGFHTIVLTSQVEGEAREVARVLSAILKEIAAFDLPLTRPAAVLMGGETTVTLRGQGKGGRNQELALAALLELKNVPGNYLLASVGTDGTDGPTDAAGGMIFPQMWQTIEQLQLHPETYLQNNDAYHFLKKVDGLIITGPTGTNVMDIIFFLVK